MRSSVETVEPTRVKISVVVEPDERPVLYGDGHASERIAALLSALSL